MTVLRVDLACSCLYMFICSFFSKQLNSPLLTLCDLFSRFNTSIHDFFCGEDKGVANGNTVLNEMEDGNDCYQAFLDDPSWPLLSKGKGN